MGEVDGATMGMGQLVIEERIGPVKQTDADADSGVDESTQAAQEPSREGYERVHARREGQEKENQIKREEQKKESQAKRPLTASRIPRLTPPESPVKRAARVEQSSSTASRRIPRSKSVPKQPFSSYSLSVAPEPAKRVSMNKIVVGHAPSPNLLQAQSRVASFSNHKYKPGGGQVKIENRKLDWKVEARTKMVNENYVPSGGDKRIESRRLTWNAESKIGSLNQNNYKPGGGDVRIENQRLEWNVESRVGSTKNIKHRAGGGNVKIHDAKPVIKATSKVGSLANMNHRAGGGDKKIFDDKEYARQMNCDFGSSTRSGPGSLNGSVRGSSLQTPEPGEGEEEIF